MTDESICVRCVELIRVKVRRHPENEVTERRICSMDNIEAILLSKVDTVEECSRFVEAP